MADGTSQNVQAWQGPPLPQRGFGTDEHVSQPGSTMVSYIRAPTLVLEAMRKPGDMSNDGSSAKKDSAKNYFGYVHHNGSESEAHWEAHGVPGAKELRT
ncbi:hypothetical protein MRX96_046025 [Rhipicephalus microplus]